MNKNTKDLECLLGHCNNLSKRNTSNSQKGTSTVPDRFIVVQFARHGWSTVMPICHEPSALQHGDESSRQVFGIVDPSNRTSLYERAERKWAPVIGSHLVKRPLKIVAKRDNPSKVLSRIHEVPWRNKYFLSVNVVWFWFVSKNDSENMQINFRRTST